MPTQITHKQICYDEQGKLECVCSAREILDDFLNNIMDIPTNLKELEKNGHSDTDTLKD